MDYPSRLWSGLHIREDTTFEHSARTRFKSGESSNLLSSRPSPATFKRACRGLPLTNRVVELYHPALPEIMGLSTISVHKQKSARYVTFLYTKVTLHSLSTFQVFMITNTTVGTSRVRSGRRIAGSQVPCLVSMLVNLLGRSVPHNPRTWVLARIASIIQTRLKHPSLSAFSCWSPRSLILPGHPNCVHRAVFISRGRSGEVGAS